MLYFKHISKVCAAAAVATLLVACAGQSELAPAPLRAASSLGSDAAPPACAGQSTSTLYAASSAKLKDRNTHACIPAFGGFGGSLHYPGAMPEVSATFTSSTTNYNGLLPALSKGTPIFYLQIATTAPVVFAQTYKASGGLISKAIKPGKTYVIYGQAKLGGVAGIMIDFTPCKATAVNVKGGGAITDLGTLFEGQSIAGPANVVVEVYPKGHVTAKC